MLDKRRFFFHMGKENKGYKSKYIYESCLAYSGLIAIKIGIQRSENWWFLIYLGIIFVCIALFNIASGYQNKKLPKIKNSNYLLKETQKKFKSSVFNNIIMMIAGSCWIIWGFKVGFWDWGIFLILFGILFFDYCFLRIDHAIELKDARESKDPYALLDCAYECFEWGDDDDGNKLLLEAIKYDPCTAKFYRNLSRFYYDMDEKDLMIICQEEADKLDPPEDELYYEEGKLKRRKKT